jgi:Lipocalin-like domain
MRYIATFVALFLTHSAVAEDDVSAKLFGAWRLVSFQLAVVGEEGAPKDVFGPQPFGRIIFSPESSVIVFISRADRRPPSNDAEAAALLSSMTAYTGKFRLEGNKFITQVDGAWNEVYKGGEQTRYFELSGNKLTIRTPEQQSGILIGKRTIATLVWQREMP